MAFEKRTDYTNWPDESDRSLWRAEEAIDLEERIAAGFDAVDGGSVPDASATEKGKIRLAGDLEGTADLPLVKGLAGKVDSDDSRLADARPPLPHSHSQGDVTGLTAALGSKVDSSDPRLSDARTPTAHSHVQGDVTGLTAALAGKVESNDSRLSDARDPLPHTHVAADVQIAGGNPGDVLTVDAGTARWKAPSGGGGSVGPWLTVAGDTVNGWENGWVDVASVDPSYPPVRFRLEGDVLRFAGVILGASASGLTMFTLPDGFRPAFPVTVGVAVSPDGSDQTYSPLTVQPDGLVIADQEFALVWLSGVTVELT